MVLVKYASRCDVLVYEHLTDPEVATPCGERSREYAEWPTCRNCHDHVCLHHVAPGTLTVDEGRETALCPSCRWQTVREKDRQSGAKLAPVRLIATGSTVMHNCTLSPGHEGACKP